jgi:hypothetical protein
MDTGTGPKRVSVFAESDYRFGAGPLRMIIEHVDWSRPVVNDGEYWYEVDGIEMTADDREIGRRRSLIRGRSLGRLRKPTTT